MTGQTGTAIITAVMLLALLAGCQGNGGSGADASDLSPDTSQSPDLATVSAAADNNSRYVAADIELRWDAPVTRTDGSALTMSDIGGYEITYSNSRGEVSVVTVDAGEYQQILTLTPDDYAFNIFVYDAQNQLSTPSETVFLRLTDFPSR